MQSLKCGFEGLGFGVQALWFKGLRNLLGFEFQFSDLRFTFLGLGFKAQDLVIRLLNVGRSIDDEASRPGLHRAPARTVSQQSSEGHLQTNWGFRPSIMQTS